MKKEAEHRSRYAYFLPIQTRWMDNDVYGHVNNVVYYSYFDTVINQFLIEKGGLDIHRGEAIGFCIESHCAYHKPVAYPGIVEAGLRVGHLGNSSVRYEVGIFMRGDDVSRADGYFVHVFVDRLTQKPRGIPAPLRSALGSLLTPA